MTKQQEQLVLDNINLVYTITKPYRSRKNYEDLVSEGYLGLCLAAINYEELRGNSFTTYAYRYILGKCLNFLNRDKLIRPRRVGSTCVDVVPVINIDDDLMRTLSETLVDTRKLTDEALMLHSIQQVLTEQEYNIVMSLYSGYTKKDIMQYMSLSQTQLSMAISNIQQKIAFIKEN